MANEKFRFENSFKIKENGCWLWTKFKIRGYGNIKVYGKKYQAHRYSMFLYKNFDLGSELFILHKPECPNKACVNPDHLYAGNQSNNMQDRITVGNNPELNKAFCPQGHEYRLFGKIRKNGNRYCKICHRDKEFARKHRNFI